MWDWLWNIIGRKAVEPIPKKTSMLITPEKFAYLTGIVIDNFEGGYYHPDMLPSFKPSDQDKLRASGETMFGLDRKAGAQLAKYPEWKVFWESVDTAKQENPDGWKYNSRGGKDAVELKLLTSDIMFKWFSELAAKYLTPDSLEAIANDDRLIIHFSYASWNGEGWFKRFSDAINKAIKTSNVKEFVFESAIRVRTESKNTVIRQQGANMVRLFAKLHL